METNDTKIEIRDLRNGDWYWIHKAVIREYTPKIGAIGVAVYSFLASSADTNQTCFPSQKYIAKRLGYSRATVNRAVKLLEEYKLIGIVKKDRYHCIYQLLKVGRCNARQTQVSSRNNSGVHQSYTNNNTITRIYNNDIDNKKVLEASPNTFKNFKPENKEELLALDLAEALNDRKGLRLYLSYTKRYPENLLRRVLGEVKEIPEKNIKKSRGALFNHLVQRYAKETN